MVFRRVAAMGGLSAAVVLLASCLSVLIARSTHLSSPVAMIEAPAPEFTLRDTDGKAVSTRSLRGNVVVLMFTDARCPVSNEYSGRIMELVRRFDDQPVQFLAVATGARVNDSSYMKELCVQRKVMGQPFPTLIDADGDVARMFGTTVTPTFYVIGRQGMLRFVGPLDDNRDAGKAKKHYLADAIDVVLNYGSVDDPELPAVGCPIER